MPQLLGFPRVALPGPAPTPLLGQWPRVLRFIADPIAAMTELRPLGDVVAVCRDSPALVCVFGPERNREVLTNPAMFRHDEQMFVGPEGSSIACLGNMITCINGERHARHRKLLAPAFSSTHLAGYAAQIVALTEARVERWPRGGQLDLDVETRELSLSVAVRTLFGVAGDADSAALGQLAEGFAAAVTHPMVLLLPRDLPATPYRRAARAGDALLARLAQLIAAKRGQHDEGRDTLSLLLQAVDDAGQEFTNDELMPELIGLFFAGYETTARTLVWTLYLLERHPQVLAALHDELAGVLGGRSVDASDLPRLVLLERVVKESMRLLPPMPILFGRVAASEVELGGRTLPKGANVVISPHATQREPDIYAEPRRFVPERWATLSPTPFEYLPFGAGPRVCIGAAFARQSLRLILATILQRVRFSIVPGARIDYQVRSLALAPKHGLPIRIAAAEARVETPASLPGNMAQLVDLPG